jgi:hypothetical protein
VEPVLLAKARAKLFVRNALTALAARLLVVTVHALVFVLSLVHPPVLILALIVLPLFLILPLLFLRPIGFRLATTVVLFPTGLTRGGLILRMFAFVVPRSLIVLPGLVFIFILLLLRLGFIAVLRKDRDRNHKEKKQNCRTDGPDDFHGASNLCIV